MGDSEYILTRHLLHSQAVDLEERVIKSNQDVHVWRMNGIEGNKGESCNTPGVCHLLSTRFELKHYKFNGNKKV